MNPAAGRAEDPNYQGSKYVDDRVELDEGVGNGDVKLGEMEM